MPDVSKRKTRIEAIMDSIRRESADRLRITVLILLLLFVGALGVSVGYLIGLPNVEAAAVEAAGTWFGALMGLAAVVVAARVFLGDKVFQDYQLQVDKDRAQAEEAYMYRQANLVTGEISVGSREVLESPVPDHDPNRDFMYVTVRNDSNHPAVNVRYRHADYQPEFRGTVDRVVPTRAWTATIMGLETFDKSLNPRLRLDR